MGLTMEEVRQKKQKERDKSLISAIEFELAGSIAHAGGELLGLSVRFGETDCLLTLRALVTSNRCIAFVGAPSLSDCFRKAVVDAYHDRLVWKVDKYDR